MGTANGTGMQVHRIFSASRRALVYAGRPEGSLDVLDQGRKQGLPTDEEIQHERDWEAQEK